MKAAAADIEDDMRERRHSGASRSRERRCLVSGEVLAEDRLVRFAADPEGNVVPDVAAVLPGRGMWVRADRDAVAQAAAKGLFSKSAKTKLSASSDLPDRVERLLAARMQSDIGLARRAGQAVAGFDNVMRALDERPGVAVLVEASDGAADGKRKLSGAAKSRGLKTQVIEVLTSTELELGPGPRECDTCSPQTGAAGRKADLRRRTAQGFPPGFVRFKLGGFEPRVPNERYV